LVDIFGTSCYYDSEKGVFMSDFDRWKQTLMIAGFLLLVFGIGFWIEYSIATSDLPLWVKFLLLRS
jgi:hypothetical protein